MSLSTMKAQNTITFANSSKNSKGTKTRIFKEIRIISHLVKKENEYKKMVNVLVNFH